MRAARACILLLAVLLVGGIVLAVMRFTLPSKDRSAKDHPVLHTEYSVLSGRVVDAHGPVAGVRVRIQGDAQFVLSDADGRFRLEGQPSAAARVTAWKEGHFIAGASADAAPLVLTLHRLPADDNEDYAWVSPDPDPAGRHNCANCHGDIFREWSAGGHARAATGRRFRDLYDDLLVQHPDGAGVCTACHAPTVPFGDAAYYDLRQVSGVAARGVHCDFCHKIAGVSNEQFGLTHGRFGFDLLRPPPHPYPSPPKRGRGEHRSPLSPLGGGEG